MTETKTLIRMKVTDTVKRKSSVGPKIRLPSLNSLKSALSAKSQFIHSFVPFFLHSFTNSLLPFLELLEVCLVCQKSVYSFICSYLPSFIHSCTNSFSDSFFYFFIFLFSAPFFPSYLRKISTFVHLFVRSFFPSFIHPSLIHFYLLI